MKNGGQGGSGPAMRRNRRTPSLPEPPPQRRAADRRRPFHDHEARSLQMLDKPLGDDLRHDLIRVVDALAALVAQGEGQRGRQVGREPVGVGQCA